MTVPKEYKKKENSRNLSLQPTFKKSPFWSFSTTYPLSKHYIYIHGSARNPIAKLH